MESAFLESIKLALVAGALMCLAACGSSGPDPSGGGGLSTASGGSGSNSGGSRRGAENGASGVGFEDASGDAAPDIEGGGPGVQGQPHGYMDSSSPPGSDGGLEDEGGCAAESVAPDEVVMLGDSYYDPFFSQAAVDLYADAQDSGALPPGTTYRHYYQGGASMNAGAPGCSGRLFRARAARAPPRVHPCLWWGRALPAHFHRDRDRPRNPRSAVPASSCGTLRSAPVTRRADPG
jgi:hypothetical protein